MVQVADTTITLTLPPLKELLILLLIGLVVGLVAEAIVGTRVPLGFVGAVILGMLGAWLTGHVVHFSISPDYTINGVPLLRSLIGAVILALVWSLAMRGRRRRATG